LAIEKADETYLADDPSRQQHDLEGILQGQAKQEHCTYCDNSRGHI
jgi:hypothetical protein